MHDTHMHKWIPPTMCHLITGTWTMTAGAVANTIAMSRGAADAIHYHHHPDQPRNE